MISDASISAVILAAGKGTRMKSQLPKVLHPLCGRSMIEWVMGAIRDSGVSDMTLVLSPELSRFETLLAKHQDVRVVVQESARGTGDAVACAALAFSGATIPSYVDSRLVQGSPISSGWTMIATGDAPAISSDTLKRFIKESKQSKRRLAVLGMRVPDPRGYGRLVCDASGSLLKIVEEKDADSATREIKLCNSGVIFCETKFLFELLSGITPNNAKNEYYLTDIFGAAAKLGQGAFVFECENHEEFAGVNDRLQLESLESWLLNKRRSELMLNGVTIHLPSTVFLGADVVVCEDSELHGPVSLTGSTNIGRAVCIKAGSTLHDVHVGAGSVIENNVSLASLRVMAGSIVSAGTTRSKQDI
jgi:bifunctional UDP-N-acetylglucosamine pyrophosphorylase/glucosamine-1-phosphate N-acetyltransferase